MTIFPLCKKYGLSISEFNFNLVMKMKLDDSIISDETSKSFYIKAEDVEAFLAKGVERKVELEDLLNQDICAVGKHGDNFTHTALLVGIEPIKRDTAEDIVRDLVNITNGYTELEPIIERARKLVVK
jgi:hypothetical protein